MKKLLLLLCPLLLHATAYTSTTNGNWNAAATWGGSGVPGNGDTAIVGNQVTVNVNTIVGASNGQWVSGSNAGAIQTNALGKVTVANGISLRIRGDFAVNNTTGTAGNALVLGAGSSFIFDSSLTSPTSTVYRMLPIAFTEFFSNPLGNGTSSAHAIITSDPGGANGRFFGNSEGMSGGADLTWTHVSNIGSATYSAMDLNPYFIGLNTVILSHVTFTACGPLATQTNMPTSAIFTFDNVYFVNSLSTTTNLTGFVFTVQPTGAGVYRFHNVVFDLGMETNIYSVGVIFDTVYIGASTSFVYYPAISSTWTTFTNVLYQKTTFTDDEANGNMVGVLILHNGVGVNPHHFVYDPWAPHTFTDYIAEYINSGTPGHVTGYSIDSQSAAYLYTLRQILTIPTPAGDSPGVCSGIAATTSNLSVDEKNCTCMIGSVQAALMTYGESGESAAGTFTRMKDNIAWDFSARAAKVLDNHTTPPGTGIVTDVVSPANADYNDGWNFVATYPSSPAWFTNEGNGYQAAYSSTPGVHDLNVNPNFVDVTRNTATFDTAYLGNVASATWASEATGHTFSVGDIISDSQATWYAGTIINYRCILSHVKSTANSETGIGSAWRTYWELATLYRVRTAMQAGVTITDSNLGLMSADYILSLRTWIKRGFQPTNAALATAASDGGVIGAEPFYSATTQGDIRGLGQLRGVGGIR